MRLFALVVVSIAWAEPLPATLELVKVVMVSRHNIRSPYPVANSTATDYSSYSKRAFPSSVAWGMSEDEFARQRLSPGGMRNSQKLGAYYKERWGAFGTHACT
jgi:hypothetical protein